LLLYAQNAEPPGLKVTMAFVLEPHPFSPVCAPLLKYKKKKEEEKKKKNTKLTLTYVYFDRTKWDIQDFGL
jgi:hypothetical protein